MFINNFKFKIVKARIIKILYCYERSFLSKDYDPRSTIDDPFGLTPTSPFGYYDKHDSFGDYREETKWIYDYSILIEYVYDNKTYTKEININNTFRIFNEGKRIKIFVERKNPVNAHYLEPFLEL